MSHNPVNNTNHIFSEYLSVQFTVNNDVHHSITWYPDMQTCHKGLMDSSMDGWMNGGWMAMDGPSERNPTAGDAR